MKIGVVAAVALFRTIAPSLQKVTDYSIRSIGGSADFCDTIGMNRFTLSHDCVTCRRSPKVSSTAFDAQPPDLPPVRLMDMGFAIIGPLARHRRPPIRFLFIRVFAPRFFPAPPRGECDFTVALRYHFTSITL